MAASCLFLLIAASGSELGNEDDAGAAGPSRKYGWKAMQTQKGATCLDEASDFDAEIARCLRIEPAVLAPLNGTWNGTLAPIAALTPAGTANVRKVGVERAHIR